MINTILLGYDQVTKVQSHIGKSKYSSDDSSGTLRPAFY